MSPFLDEEDDDIVSYPPEEKREIKQINGNDGGRFSFPRDDKNLFIIGGGASMAAFCAVAYFMYSSSKPIDLDELPIIKADSSQLKVQPADNNTNVSHQVTGVYDNISGDKRESVVTRTIPQPEEVLSINEMESDGSLSEEEKRNIIKAFDELAVEKEYKINYVKTGGGSSTNSPLDDAAPPIKRIDDDGARKDVAKKRRHGLGNLVNIAKDADDGAATTAAAAVGSVMVQVASVPTKSGAEAEYKRILAKNQILRGVGKKVFKVDLGKNKGTTYRIQVGPFKNKADALKVVSSMRNSGFSAYISR
jgi:cell division protein FtsN